MFFHNLIVIVWKLKIDRVLVNMYMHFVNISRKIQSSIHHSYMVLIPTLRYTKKCFHHWYMILQALRKMNALLLQCVKLFRVANRSSGSKRVISLRSRHKIRYVDGVARLVIISVDVQIQCSKESDSGFRLEFE